ncbi:transcriptional regulator ICP4 [Beluga whale alphaherpesvirus 1]|uniref:Transcriptional regulator ICP4 n=1 Tax=Beluga whale alphaherpesvirus 1 TaxID=1434720 RepID=A0A286MM89_9ALPH|nr:transcriptional regulator ICP4 [Beluga whale alphaherpesvirus 1]YP_010085008.1 transcriptional regulator ICP4 [Beluga whale alphaherpesvirus 1]ASW27106.1 transcriptional regulator ICP4 [Beluga whale alphaherpesvirus 1]ASW27115.1 transcriptional regulator ICP4 [Beluga whale alphaherpesvirus 1]
MADPPTSGGSEARPGDAPLSPASDLFSLIETLETDADLPAGPDGEEEEAQTRADAGTGPQEEGVLEALLAMMHGPPETPAGPPEEGPPPPPFGGGGGRGAEMPRFRAEAEAEAEAAAAAEAREAAAAEARVIAAAAAAATSAVRSPPTPDAAAAHPPTPAAGSPSRGGAGDGPSSSVPALLRSTPTPSPGGSAAASPSEVSSSSPSPPRSPRPFAAAGPADGGRLRRLAELLDGEETDDAVSSPGGGLKRGPSPARDSEEEEEDEDDDEDGDSAGPARKKRRVAADEAEGKKKKRKKQKGKKKKEKGKKKGAKRPEEAADPAAAARRAAKKEKRARREKKRRRREARAAAAAAAAGSAAEARAAAGPPAVPLLTPFGDPWPGTAPPPGGRVRFGGTGESRAGMWDCAEVREAAGRLERASWDTPAAVYVPEMGRPEKQYAALVHTVYHRRDAASWLQNPRLSGPDLALAHVVQRRVQAAHGRSSFITGSVVPSLPHVGDAMAAGNALWALPHVAACLAMSRRYDSTQKLFLICSLRRAFAGMARPEAAAAAEPSAAAASDAEGGEAPAPSSASPPTPSAPGPASAAAAYEELRAALEGAAGGPRRPAARAKPARAALARAGEACVAACGEALAAVIRVVGLEGLARVPGLDAPETLPTAACGPDALAGEHPRLTDAAASALLAVRDALDLRRLTSAWGPDGPAAELRAAVRAVAVAARTVAPLIRYDSSGAAAGMLPVLHLVGDGSVALARAFFATPAAVATRIRAAVAALALRAAAEAAGGGGDEDDRADEEREAAVDEDDDDPEEEDEEDESEPDAGSDSDTDTGDEDGPPPAAAAAAAAAAPGSRSPSAAAADPASPTRVSSSTPEAAARRRGAVRARILGRKPPEGPHPSGGFRRVTPGRYYTPAPSRAALDAYCGPEIVDGLVHHEILPEKWRAAFAFDPEALAALAARCTSPRVGGGGPGPGGLGRLVVTDPLRARLAWTRQIEDPEDVRVVFMYAPLPGESLAGPPARAASAAAAAADDDEPADGPRWPPARGGLSHLLAALGNRALVGPGDQAWAGRWTAPPDVSALNARGVLLLSTRDVGFVGAVEYLCARFAAARRPLIVADAVAPEDWPRDGPAVPEGHVYLRAALRPEAHCALRWPEAPELGPVVLTACRVVGPGFFERVEREHARLYPGAPPLALCRGANVTFVVATRAGPRTPVPLAPREYRGRVLPALDGCKDMAAQSGALGLGAPDFANGETVSDRAANRWGLGATLRPVYLPVGRDFDRLRGPGDLDPAVAAFAAAARLLPDPDAPPFALPAGLAGDADPEARAAARARVPAPPPQAVWDRPDA